MEHQAEQSRVDFIFKKLLEIRSSLKTKSSETNSYDFPVVWVTEPLEWISIYYIFSFEYFILKVEGCNIWLPIESQTITSHLQNLYLP